MPLPAWHALAFIGIRRMESAAAGAVVVMAAALPAMERKIYKSL